jgi:N4-gp56 family major capsid protein
LTGSGKGDDSTLTGYEEALDVFNMEVEVHQRRNAVKSKGKMTDQRTSINIKREGTVALGDWTKEVRELDYVYALSGIANDNQYIGETPDSEIETVNEHAPSTNRIIRIGQTNAGAVHDAVATDSLLGADSATDYLNFLFGRQIISKVKARAKMANPKFRPINIGGKSYYVMLLHPYQVMALRNEVGDATTGFMSWTAIQAAAGVRGNENPLFQKMVNGAIGIFDDVILFEYDRILTRAAGEVFDAGDAIHSNVPAGVVVARSLFLGAQAATLAWAKLPTPAIEEFDYKDKTGVAIDMIYGVSKSVFTTKDINGTGTDQEDFATYCVDTCAVAA